MAAGSRAIVAWSRLHGPRLPRQWHLTKAKLCLKSQSFVHLTGKGWHTNVILRFLVDTLHDDANCDPLLKTACWSAQNFLGLLSESRKLNGLFLQASEVNQVKTVADVFFNTYLRLRLKYTGWCVYKLFNIRPKFHLLVHLVDSCVHLKNPVASSTWMDEDWLKHIGRVARKTHVAKTQQSALQRYLAGLDMCMFCPFCLALFHLQDSKR